MKHQYWPLQEQETLYRNSKQCSCLPIDAFSHPPSSTFAYSCPTPFCRNDFALRKSLRFRSVGGEYMLAI